MQSPSRRWLICGFLFLATIVNYLDRQTISVSASKIASEMQLTDKHLGQLFFGFLFAYGIAQLIVGPLLDRFGTIAAYAVAVAAWSLAGASSGLATSFGFLFATRLLLGLCESPNWPLALRTVTQIFPPAQRTLATGIFQSGTSIGALVAPPIIIWFATTYDWRMSFYVIGAVGFGWVALWLAWFRLRPEPSLAIPPCAAAATDAKTPASMAAIIRSRAFWGMTITAVFINPLQYFYTTWLPRYFDHYAGLGFGKALAQHLVIVYLALDLGLWSGGALVAWLSRRWEVRRARLTVAAVGVACMAVVPVVSQLHNLAVITTVIAVAAFGLGGFMANYLVFSAEVSTARVSTAVGLQSGLGSLAGAGFMLLVGGSIERSGGFGLAFLMTGLLPLVALAGMWFSQAPERRVSS